MEDISPMRHQSTASLTFATAVAIAFFSISSVPAVLRAQEPTRHDQQHKDDQRPQADAQRHDDQARPGDHNNGARHDDDADQLRRDHPGAMARCHDGFFTKSDRNRACTRHGGIDVWLGPEQ